MSKSTTTLEELYEIHGSSVLALVRALGVWGDEGFDVAQDVWLAAYQRLASYDASQGSHRAWLAGIARNMVKTWRRTRKRRPEFSTPADDAPELRDGRTPEAATEREEIRQDLYAFLSVAIANEERREAFVLHEIFGLSVREVARETGVTFFTAQYRLKMARKDFDEARKALTDEEKERLRGVVLLFPSSDAMIEAMRPKPSAADAKLWERIAKRIAEDGGQVAPSLPTAAQPPLPPFGAPHGFTVTGSQIAAGILATFLVGAGTGAVLQSLLSRDKAPASVVAMNEPLPVPTSTPERLSSASAAPSARAAPSASSAPRSVTRSASASASSDSLLFRMHAAIEDSPALALALADEHARLFPAQDAARREEIAVCALVQLGQRAEAEGRAVKLVQSAPSLRPKMEALFGHALP